MYDIQTKQSGKYFAHISVNVAKKTAATFDFEGSAD